MNRKITNSFSNCSLLYWFGIMVFEGSVCLYGQAEMSRWERPVATGSTRSKGQFLSQHRGQISLGKHLCNCSCTEVRSEHCSWGEKKKFLCRVKFSWFLLHKYRSFSGKQNNLEVEVVNKIWLVTRTISVI